jgi:hypothetical protein
VPGYRNLALSGIPEVDIDPYNKGGHRRASRRKDFHADSIVLIDPDPGRSVGYISLALVPGTDPELAHQPPVGMVGIKSDAMVVDLDASELTCPICNDSGELAKRKAARDPAATANVGIHPNCGIAGAGFLLRVRTWRYLRHEAAACARTTGYWFGNQARRSDLDSYCVLCTAMRRRGRPRRAQVGSYSGCTCADPAPYQVKNVY